MRRSKVFSFFLLAILITVSFSTLVTPAKAATIHQDITPWCGTTSETQNYGFNYSLSQNYWTVNGENYVSQDTIDQVDVILTNLNDDNIANTMVLFIDKNEVTVGPSCAGDFLMYMRLGNASGPREANGFAWLIEVDQANKSIEVHYSVGGSLNALISDKLKGMNRLAQDTYSQTGSLDTTLITLVNAFDEYARSQYEPYHPDQTSATAQVLPIEPATTSNASATNLLFLCFVILLIIIGGAGLFWLFFGNWGGNTDPEPTAYDSEPVVVHHTRRTVDDDPAPTYHHEESHYESPVHHSDPPVYHPSTPMPTYHPPSPTPTPHVGGGNGGTTRVG